MSVQSEIEWVMEVARKKVDVEKELKHGIKYILDYYVNDGEILNHTSSVIPIDEDNFSISVVVWWTKGGEDLWQYMVSRPSASESAIDRFDRAMKGI